MNPSPTTAIAPLPWHVFTNASTQWEHLPTFLLGEYVIVLAAILALVHAVRRGRAHFVVWLAALVAGTANDLIFMALPLVDNFWHGQATMMLTPRLPLYIPCLYVLFMYYPVVAVARLGFTRWPTAALSGLLAVLTYAPFDIVGAKFLWWTWHDTDVPIEARLLGVPTSSTLWVLTFSGAFAWLVAPVLLVSERPDRRSSLLALLRVAGLTTLVMMVQMVPLQRLDGGAPGYVALATGLMVYAIVASRGRVARPRPTDSETLPFVAMLLYLATLSFCITGFDPATHVSTGVHETVGPCDVEARDITGATRRAYLCLEDFREDYSFACTERPAPGSRWYTICGRPFSSRTTWLSAVLALCAAGSLAYSRTFGSFRRDPAADPEEASARGEHATS